MYRTVLLLVFLLSCGGETSSKDVGSEAAPGDIYADTAPDIPLGDSAELAPDPIDAALELSAPELPDLLDALESVDVEVAVDMVEAVTEVDGSAEVDTKPEVVVPPTALPEHVWSHSFGSTGAEEAVSMAVDGEGRIFLAGSFHSDALDFGGEVLLNKSTLGMRDVFVVAFDPDGGHLWSVSFGGEDDDVMYSLALNEDGEIHVAGYFRSDSIDFGAGPELNQGKRDLFFVKLSGAGELIWARTFGGEMDDATFSLDVNSEGAVFITGYFSSESLDLGGGPMENVSATGYHDIYAARFTGDGEHVWSKRFGGSSWEFARAVSVTGEALYLGGRFYSSGIEFGDETFENQGDADFFVLKMDLSGETLWARQYGGPEHDACHGLVGGPDGSVFVTGTSKSHVLDLGGGPVSHVGPLDFHDMFVFGLSPDGDHLWSHVIGGFSWEMGRAITTDEEGSVYVTGAYYSEGLDFGGGPLKPAGTGQGEADLFLVKLTSGGEHEWSRSFGGPANDFGHAVAAMKSGGVLLAGGFNGGEGEGDYAIDFGGGELPEYGAFDVFLARFGQEVAVSDEP